MSGFAESLLAWFDVHGRHDLPWQHPRTPYRVWLSEIMLQQTQVTTVIPYFERFLQAFPELPDLARAPLDAVLAQWAGLGYYSRARNLHRAAQVCVAEHHGQLPASLVDLIKLPGIGRSTAAAILSQAFGQPAAVLDGNVKRVLSRVHGITEPVEQRHAEQRLWQLAEAALPTHRAADYTQAIMDFGATLCTQSQPACLMCPIQSICQARQLGLTATIPAKTAKAQVPERHTRMLLLKDGGHGLILERRPERGIWGGLYSLPELPVDADPGTWCDAHYRLRIGPTSTFSQFRHKFTHFTLRAEVLEAVVLPTAAMMDPGPLQWVSRAQLPTLGLPKPIKTLLKTLLVN
ncbi:A/G-specific adenine glycosylase [Ahniella affigens]|uniref:Adenine DNA glycosylase n=1 Tax=Ahniella affigens TaxID=2021234 RepID=A0A2P1PN88_9GAMM|nr:A/G-specific adenine glycosylase [Ahniella affigens]AVP96299.1 A/G-specific adenine glycosylase [Ahniella affigens]